MGQPQRAHARGACSAGPQPCVRSQSAARTAAPAPRNRDPFFTRHPSGKPFWQRHDARPYGWTTDDEEEHLANQDSQDVSVYDTETDSEEHSEMDDQEDDSEASEDDSELEDGGWGPFGWNSHRSVDERVEQDRMEGRAGCCWAEQDWGVCNKPHCSYRHRGEY